MAYDDFVYADTMLRVTRNDPDATPEAIAARERARRIRMAIANAMDFLIANEREIDAIIETNRRKAP